MSDSLAMGAAIGVAITLAAYLGIALYDFKRLRGSDDYFFFGNRLSTRQASATIFASGMSFATVLIALLQLGLAFGIGLLWAPLTYCIGWILLASAAGRIRDRCHGSMTLHGFLGESYSSTSLTVVASAATILGFLGAFATEIIAGTILFEALGWGNVSALVSVGVFAAVTIVYCALGGFRSVIRSDSLQSLLLIPGVVLFLLLAIWLRQDRGLPGLFDRDAIRSWQLPVLFAVSLALINIPFPFVDMSAWQRLRATHSLRAWRRGTLVAVAGFGLTWTMLTLAAASLSGAIPADSNPFVALLHGIEPLLGRLTPILGFILFPALIAAMLSTADTFLNAAGHTFSIDIRHRLQEPPSASTQQSARPIRAARRDLTLLGLAGFGLCLLLSALGFGIVELIFAVYGAALALFPPVILALLVRKKTDLSYLRKWALAAIVLGFVAGWFNGVYSVICPSFESGLLAAFQDVFPCDPYRSPLYAFVTSGVVFLVGLALQFGRLRRAVAQMPKTDGTDGGVSNEV